MVRNIVPVGILLYTLYIFGVVIYDVTHPELWKDWLHDPRIYGVPFVVACCVIWMTFRRHCHEEAVKECAAAIRGRTWKPGEEAQAWAKLQEIERRGPPSGWKLLRLWTGRAKP